MLAESINSRHLVIQCSNIPQKGDVTIRKKGWHALQNPEVEPNTMNDTDGLHMNSAVENTIGDLDAFAVTAAVDVNKKKRCCSEDRVHTLAEDVSEALHLLSKEENITKAFQEARFSKAAAPGHRFMTRPARKEFDGPRSSEDARL